MNLFYLSEDFEESARFHVDQHIIKIITETAQCLSVALNEKGLYKRTHENHVIVRWLRESASNIEWAANYGKSLFQEYLYRYNKPEKYQTARKIFDIALDNLQDFPAIQRTEFKVAVPENARISDDPVIVYRAHYNKNKRHLFFKKNGAHRWTKREIPEWITP